MDPKAETIRALRQKHGAFPLIQLIRRLVVAIDQTDMGSEHRRQTLRLLNLLTGQGDLPPNSHAWLDWVEENEGELTWESLEQKHFGSSKVGRLRKTVELPEDEGPKVRPRPMTKEQQIWDKALSRQGQKKHRRAFLLISSLVLGVLMVSVILLRGNRYWDEYFSSQEAPVVDAEVGRGKKLPLSLPMLWADHMPRYAPLSEDALDRALVDGLLSLPMDLSWFDSPPTEAEVLLVDAIAQERSFSAARSSLGMREMNWKSFPSSKRRWRVQIEMAQTHLFVEQEVSFKQNSDYCEVVVRRTKGRSQGVAHRFFLNGRGVMAWAWRLTLRGQVLEGQWSRSLSKGTAQIQLNLPSGKLWSQELSCPADLTLLPALDIPSFRDFRSMPRVMPITGRICSESNFPAGRLLDGDGLHFSFEGLDGRWTEVWTALKSP